jgi:hypothetical protein
MVFDNPYTLHMVPRELYANTAREAYLEARHLEGRLLLRTEAGRRLVLHEPQMLSRTRVEIRRVPGPTWVWEVGGRLLPCGAAADELLRLFLELRVRQRR